MRRGRATRRAPAPRSRFRIVRDMGPSARSAQQGLASAPVPHDPKWMRCAHLEAGNDRLAVLLNRTDRWRRVVACQLLGPTPRAGHTSDDPPLDFLPAGMMRGRSLSRRGGHCRRPLHRASPKDLRGAGSTPRPLELTVRRAVGRLPLPLSGSNSVVECNLAKVDVAGSNPVSRSSRPPAPQLSQVGLQ